MVEYRYNAWGTQLSRRGELANTLGYANPFRYRGYIYDDETWMYWLRSRYYYPELHRFINADELFGRLGEPLDHNLYVYCRNNATMLRDPCGTAAIRDLVLGGGYSTVVTDEVIREEGWIQIRKRSVYTYVPYCDAQLIAGISKLSEWLKGAVEDKMKKAMGVNRKIVLQKLSEYLLSKAVSRRERRIAVFLPKWLLVCLVTYDVYDKASELAQNWQYVQAVRDATSSGYTGIVQVDSTIYSNDRRILPTMMTEYFEWTDYLYLCE